MRNIILLILFLFIPTFAWADISTGLVGWWQLDEGSGSTSVDSSGTGNSMSLKSSPTWIAGQRGPYALQFNGTNQALQSSVTEDLSGTSVITIAFWLYENAFNNSDELMLEFGANYNTTNGGILLDPNSGGGLTGCVVGNFDISSSDGQSLNGHYNLYELTRPSAAAWHHYIFVIYKSNASSNLAWVDGVSSSLTHCQSNALVGNFANTTLNFMSRNNASLFNAGKMDDIRIYNRAFNSTDASQLYAQAQRYFNRFLK